MYVSRVIVSTRRIQWILWFSVCYTAATCREIFGVNTQWKARPASFTKFAGYLLWEIRFTVTEILLIRGTSGYWTKLLKKHDRQWRFCKM